MSLYRIGGMVAVLFAGMIASVLVFVGIAEYRASSHGGFGRPDNQAPAPRWGRGIGVHGLWPLRLSDAIAPSDQSAEAAQYWTLFAASHHRGGLVLFAAMMPQLF